MKKFLALSAALVLGAAVLTGCGGGKGTSSTDGKSFTPKETVNWCCTSSPGGGSDIFSRQIADILT